MSGWVWESTLRRLCDTFKRPNQKFPYKSYPDLAYCDKEQLQELWDELYEKLDNYYRLMEDPCMEVGLELEKYYLEKIYQIESQIEEIDYQWSRFSELFNELDT